jgi:hypothetical protein
MPVTRLLARPCFGVYVHRLCGLAIAVRDGCDEIFEIAALPARGMYVKVDPALHARIDGVLIAAANIKRLIGAAPGRSKNESRRRYGLRCARSEILAGLVDLPNLSALLDSGVRNSLEHFDEHLDHLVESIADGDSTLTSAAYNMTLSHWEALPERHYPLRIYVAVERKFYNFERVIDLDALRSQAGSLVDSLMESDRHGLKDGRAGLVVLFGRKQ